MSRKSANPYSLTDLQLKFCLEYARSLNATDSYKRAGYKFANDDVARASGSRLLANVNIRAYLSDILNLSEVSVINEIVKIALANITDAVTWDETGAHLIPSDRLSDRGKAAIKKIKIKKTRRIVSKRDSEPEVEETIETEVEMYSRLDALEKLMKKLNLYPREAVETKVFELLQGRLNEEINLLFEQIASDPDIPTEAKQRMFAAAAQLQERSSVAGEN